MLTVIVVMLLGIVIGFFVRKRNELVKRVDKLIMWAIYLLLFLLGVAIGANEVIIKNLPTLGIKALIISTGGVTGSVLVAWIGYHVWFKPKINGDEK